MNRHQLECQRLAENRQLLFQRQLDLFEARRLVEVEIAQTRNKMSQLRDTIDREWQRQQMENPVKYPN